MCGRYTQTIDVKKLSKELGIPASRIPPLKPRYNIAPSQPVACLLHEPEKEPEIQLLRWGLIPSWAKDASIGHRMINARMESLAAKPAFKGLLKNHRCLVIADGFYEWKQEGKGKRPYYICLKSRGLCTFAGLWAEWNNPEGEAMRSCTIVTGPPNELVARLHNRMPVIIQSKYRFAWIEPSYEELDKILGLLKPYPSNEMEIYAVSSLVNSPKNEVAECMKAYTEKSLFSK